MYTLEDLGWGPFFQQNAKQTQDLIPARVAEEQRGAYVLFAEQIIVANVDTVFVVASLTTS